MAKKQSKRKTVTALVRRPVRPLVLAPRLTLESAPALRLGEEATTGALGLVEVKLTKAEELVLARPVPLAEMLIKPTGQPYLSHPTYTRWFNTAFGRLGWSIVPMTKARFNGKTVTVDYLLYVHGKPVAFATGEQEYYGEGREGGANVNNEQTQGDAIEATVASALRRCAKRLGVGLELWDKPFLEQFMHAHCVQVWRTGSKSPQWRLKTSAPFYDEKGPVVKGGQPNGRQQPSYRPPPEEFMGGDAPIDVETSPAPERQAPAVDKRLITAVGRDGKGHGQVGRLATIASRAGRSKPEVKAWILAIFGFRSMKEITRDKYDEICKAVEQPGALPGFMSHPEFGEREVGEDG